MIETIAFVLRTEDELAWVEIRPNKPCGMCDPEKGCRSLAISKMFSRKNPTFCVSNSIGAQSGDLVSISISEKNILSSVMLLYLLPLIGLFVGAIIGAIFTETWSVIAGVFSFMFMFVLVRFLIGSKFDQQLPDIIAKINVNILSGEGVCHLEEPS